MMNMQQQDPSTTYQQQQQQQQPMMMMKQPPQPQPPPQFPEQEHLKCPRCDSPNTKFCYYNNYNLSQPRHFCKNCRRYWTKGGALRNIPIGGGTRKSTKRSSSSTSNPKRHSSSSSANSTISTPNPSTPPQPPLLIAQNSGLKTEPSSIYGGPVDQDCRMLDITGSLSFSSLLASSGQFGNLLAGLNPNNNGSGIRTMQLGGFSQNLSLDNGLGSDMGRNPDLELQNGHNNNDNSESFLGIQSGGDSSCWSGGGGGGGGGGSNGWPDLAI